MSTSSNIRYRDYNYLLTSLVTMSTIATLAVAAEPERVLPYDVNAHTYLQTSQNDLGNYNSLRLTTQIENVVHNNLNNSLDLLLKNEIIEKTSNMFGYSILEIHESSLTDEEETFKVYTFLLDLEVRDYSVLLEQEWELSKSLGLYEQNTILRFV